MQLPLDQSVPKAPLWEQGKKASRLLVCSVLLVLLLSPVRAGDASVAITAVASLTDPEKIATLTGKRAANDRLHKVLAWLEEARRAGMHPSKTLDEAQKLTGDSFDHAAVVKEMLLRNFELCERSALFTPDNLDRMKHGESPHVISGTYIGQAYEVDHIIPVAEFPQLGNELANLIYLPRAVNRRKSDEIKQRALDLGQKLTAAGVLTPEEYAQLRRIRTWGKPAESSSASSSTSTPSTSPDPMPTGPIVNVNTASAAVLEALPGIGPKAAAAIIAARPLKGLSDLDAVPGIGPKTFEAVRDLVSF